MAQPATARTSSFTDILKVKRGEVERPSPMPVGDYVCVVSKDIRQDKSKVKSTPFVEYTYKVLEALESVDTDQLDEWLTKKDGSKKKLSEVTIKDTYYITEGSLWRLEDMLKACLGEDSDMSMEQAIRRERAEERDHPCGQDSSVRKGWWLIPGEIPHGQHHRYHDYEHGPRRKHWSYGVVMRDTRRCDGGHSAVDCDQPSNGRTPSSSIASGTSVTPRRAAMPLMKG